MYTTAEVRWFFPGMIPDDIRDWFTASVPSIHPPEKRTDKYLVLPDNSTTSIKLREQRIEIKLRKFKYGEVQLHDSVSGHMECWQKWSLGLDHEVNSLGDIMNRASGWLDISKARTLCRYAVEDKIVVRPIGLHEVVESGCEVELTSVEILDDHWWTFAYESFGEEYILSHNLARVSEEIFESCNPPQLPTAQSFGYPRWLQRILPSLTG